MSYREGESYVPALIPATVRDHVSSLSLVSELNRLIELPAEALSPQIVDFQARLRDSDDYEIGPRMVRAAARLVTETAPKHLETAPLFVAFAVDWEAEGDELERILKECGASPETLADFRSRGWLSPSAGVPGRGLRFQRTAGQACLPGEVQITRCK